MRVTWGAKGQGPDKTAGQDNLSQGARLACPSPYSGTEPGKTGCEPVKALGTALMEEGCSEGTRPSISRTRSQKQRVPNKKGAGRGGDTPSRKQSTRGDIKGTLSCHKSLFPICLQDKGQTRPGGQCPPRELSHHQGDHKMGHFGPDAAGQC